VVPDLPSNEVIGPYEDESRIRLLLFARGAGSPLLVEFGYKTPKVFEENLRHSAKIRSLDLHFYRLTGGQIATEVEPRGARFSRRLVIMPCHRAERIT
jgi:hypothetical protein